MSNNIRTQNRFAGKKFFSGNSESISSPTVNEETLTTHVINFAVAQLAIVDQINSFKMGRNASGAFKSKPDERKAFADIVITNLGKKAAIVINKSDEQAKTMV